MRLLTEQTTALHTQHGRPEQMLAVLSSLCGVSATPTGKAEVPTLLLSSGGVMLFFTHLSLLLPYP